VDMPTVPEALYTLDLIHLFLTIRV